MAGPRTTVEAQAFYRMYHSYADIQNPWDRLRWCRYGLDLLQKEVAAMVGMEEWLYRDLESGAFHRSCAMRFGFCPCCGCSSPSHFQAYFR